MPRLHLIDNNEEGKTLRELSILYIIARGLSGREDRQVVSESAGVWLEEVMSIF